VNLKKKNNKTRTKKRVEGKRKGEWVRTHDTISLYTIYIERVSEEGCEGWVDAISQKKNKIRG
jgi:hypothetical protein